MPVLKPAKRHRDLELAQIGRLGLQVQHSSQCFEKL